MQLLQLKAHSLVFDKEIFDSPHAILVPETSDGRVLFILPWHDKIVVGTTDVKVDTPSLAPQAQPEEIDFILATLNAYGTRQVTRKDIRSVFCGQRPLVKPANAKNTAKISRKHEIIETSNGLITMVGGKWTIYRRMGQDTINYIEQKPSYQD
jgi:Glycerol-3-phosphate dehydrogenase